MSSIYRPTKHTNKKVSRYANKGHSTLLLQTYVIQSRVNLQHEIREVLYEGLCGEIREERLIPDVFRYFRDLLDFHVRKFQVIHFLRIPGFLLDALQL